MNKIYALTNMYEREEQECGTSIRTKHLCFYETKEEAETHLEILKTNLGAHRDYMNWRIKSNDNNGNAWRQYIDECFRLHLPWKERDYQGPMDLKTFKEVEYNESKIAPTVSNCSTLFGSFIRKDLKGKLHRRRSLTKEENMPTETITLDTYEDFYEPPRMEGELVYIEEIPLFKPLKEEVES